MTTLIENAEFFVGSFLCNMGVFITDSSHLSFNLDRSLARPRCDDFSLPTFKTQIGQEHVGNLSSVFTVQRQSVSLFPVGVLGIGISTNLVGSQFGCDEFDGFFTSAPNVEIGSKSFVSIDGVFGCSKASISINKARQPNEKLPLWGSDGMGTSSGHECSLHAPCPFTYRELPAGPYKPGTVA